MAFTPKWTAEAAATFERLQAEALSCLKNRRQGRRSRSTKAEGLFKQVEKCVRLLLENPRHPGLQTHEYLSIESPHDKNEKVFEAYIQNRTPGAYRLFWCYGPKHGEITIVAITPHP